MRRWVLVAVLVLLLAGIAAAEPQPVDSDWQRSDGVPVEIEPLADAPPETAEEAEGEAADSGGRRVLLAVLAATCLIGLAAAVLWVRRTRRAAA